MSRIASLGTVAAALLLATACGTTSSEPSRAPERSAASQPSSAPGAATPSKAATAPKQLRFTSTTLQGKPFDGATLAGKPAALWFWAPWCPKCHAEASHVAAVAKRYADDVAFVGVASRDKKAAMQKFVRDTKTGGFTHLADEDGSVWAKFGVIQTSYYVLIKADGSMEQVAGPLSEADLAKHVKSLI